MFCFIKKMFFKCYNNRILRYIFYGGLTTLVNLIVYYVLRGLFKIPIVPANTASVICAVLFAYVVNSRFVFESEADTLTEHATELVKFVGARLSTMVIEVFGVWFLAEVIHMNDFLGKIVIQFIVMALNYIFSKLIVFRKKRRPEQAQQ